MLRPTRGSSLHLRVELTPVAVGVEGAEVVPDAVGQLTCGGISQHPSSPRVQRRNSLTALSGLNPEVLAAVQHHLLGAERDVAGLAALERGSGEDAAGCQGGDEDGELCEHFGMCDMRNEVRSSGRRLVWKEKESADDGVADRHTLALLKYSKVFSVSSREIIQAGEWR